ncbi:MAG TPA: hypothetical protein ACFYD4_13270 [Candidatus Wunengus sp. YC61]|uniref:hypothetical protein n=1 Tax=Candidatus Wunengus sp. YC61 TaxID=3367698 RepID=UPI0040290DCB
MKGWVERRQNPTPTIRSVHGILGFVSRITYGTCRNPTKLFPKRCSLSGYNFLRVPTKSTGFTDFLSVNPAFSKGVYRQYKLKIVEGLIIQPKIGLQ